MDERSTRIKVYAVACISSLTMGLSFLAAKTSLNYATPLEALFSRFVIAFLFAMVLSVIGLVKIDFRGKPVKKLLGPASLYSLGFFGFQFFGLTYATSIEAGILFAIMPAFTMIIAEIFLKEKPNILQRICVYITIVSVLVLFIFNSGGVGEVSLFGVILLFISSVCMAANNVMVRWLRDAFSPAEISTAACALGCAVYGVVLLISGGIKGTLGHTAALFVNGNFMIAAIYLGVGCTMLTTLMNSYLMAHLEAVKTSAFGNVATMISICVGALILHEPLTWVHIVCAAVIILGVLGTNFFKGKQNEEGKL